MKNFTASLLHTAWTEDEKSQLDKTINFVEEYDEEDFLTAACHYLYRILGIDHIHIGLTLGIGSLKQIHTVVKLESGVVSPAIYYSLNKSPFNKIYDNDFMYLPFGLSAMYPQYEAIKKYKYESYIGMPLLNSEDEPLGIIVMLHNRIIERGGYVEALLNALVPKIETELSVKKSFSMFY